MYAMDRACEKSPGKTRNGRSIVPLPVSGTYDRLIELVQEYCTVSRSGDWYDFAANAAGGLIGAGFGYYFARWKLYK